MDDDDDEGGVVLIEDEAPEDSAFSRSLCSVCHRSMPVTRLGLICVHGPVLNRCPGSQKPPTWINTCQRGNIPDIPDSVQAFTLHRVPVKILKRVPHTSCDVSARKLAEILDHILSDGSESSWEHISVSLPAAYKCQIEAANVDAWLHTPTSLSKRKRTRPLSSLP